MPTKIQKAITKIVIAILITLAALCLLFVGVIVYPPLQPYYLFYSNAFENFMVLFLGAVFAGLAGVIAVLLQKESDLETDRVFFANVFLEELEKLKGFISEIHEKGINSKDFVKGPIESLSPFDWDLEMELVVYLRSNKYYIIKKDYSFIDKKSPFELFYSKIYLLENQTLIDDLRKLVVLLDYANSVLTDYYDHYGDDDRTHELESRKIYHFLKQLEEIEEKINKILSEQELKKV
jgi:hypothetical protein